MTDTFLALVRRGLPPTHMGVYLTLMSSVVMRKVIGHALHDHLVRSL